MTSSGHVEAFCREHLTARALWPALELDGVRAGAAYAPRVHCAVALPGSASERGLGDRPGFHTYAETWSYARLQATANRIAHALVDDLGIVPGNRVLLRAPNTPMLVACWFAVLKAGGVVVCTMPLLRTREIAY